MAITDQVQETDLKRIYTPIDGKVMHVLDFASGSGTIVRESILESREPGSRFSIDGLVTDKEKSKGKRIGALTYAEQFGIEAITLDGFKGCGSWKEAQKTEQGKAEYRAKMLDYNAALLDRVQKFEQEHGFTFDLALLAGYMRWVTDPLLAYFKGRMVNVHPANLDISKEGGWKRKLIGGNTVYDALVAGHTQTRSCVILVEEGEDSGAVLASGLWVPYEGERPITQERSDEHQGKQKEKSDWPVTRFTLRAIANGQIGLHTKLTYSDGNPLVVYKNQLQGYQGIDLAQRPELLRTQ